MEWQSFGFKDDPLKTSPITKSTLELFTGHKEEARICMDVLSGGNVRIAQEVLEPRHLLTIYVLIQRQKNYTLLQE